MIDRNILMRVCS